MRVERRENIIFFWLNGEEFQALEEALLPIERISYDKLDEEGYLNLMLDFPIGQRFAVLDPETLTK